MSKLKWFILFVAIWMAMQCAIQLFSLSFASITIVHAVVAGLAGLFGFLHLIMEH